MTTVEWLRWMADSCAPMDTADWRNEFLAAADEIERLRTERDAYRTALEKFVGHPVSWAGEVLNQ